MEPSAGKTDGNGKREDYMSMAGVTLLAAIPSLGSNPRKLEQIVAALARDAEAVFKPRTRSGNEVAPVTTPGAQGSSKYTSPQESNLPAGKGVTASQPDYSGVKMQVTVWSNADNNAHLTPSQLAMFKQLGSDIAANGAVSYRLNCERNDLLKPRNYIVDIFGNGGREITIQAPKGQENSIGPELYKWEGVFEGRAFKLRPFGRDRNTWGPVVIVDGKLDRPFQLMMHYVEVLAAVQLDGGTRGQISIQAPLPEDVYNALSANNFAQLEQMVRTVLPRDLVAYIESKPVIYAQQGSLGQRSIFNTPRMVVKVT